MKVTKWYESADRYKFDFGMCSYENGWAQIDTSQDAFYYGAWCHPEEFKLFSYAEGDCCLKECDNVEEFKTEIESLADWNKKMEFKFAIDAYKRTHLFEAIGLGHLCH